MCGVANRMGFAGESKPRHVVPNTIPDLPPPLGSHDNIEGSPLGRKLAPLFIPSPPTPDHHAELTRRLHNLFRDACLHRLLVDPRGKRVVVVEGMGWAVGAKRAVVEAIVGCGQAASITFIPHPIASLLPHALSHAITIHLGHSDSVIAPVYDRRVLWSVCRWHPRAGAAVGERIREGVKMWGGIVVFGEGGDEGVGTERRVTEADLVAMDLVWREDAVARCCFAAALPDWKKRHYDLNVDGGAVSTFGEEVADEQDSVHPPFLSSARDVLVPLPLVASDAGEALVRVPGFVRERAIECLFESTEFGEAWEWADYRVPRKRSSSHNEKEKGGWEVRRREWYGGVAVEVADVLLALPLDLRPVCVSHILITGGLSHMPGLRARVAEEVRWTLERDPRYKELAFLAEKVAVIQGVWDGGIVGWTGANRLHHLLADAGLPAHLLSRTAAINLKAISGAAAAAGCADGSVSGWALECVTIHMDSEIDLSPILSHASILMALHDLTVRQMDVENEKVLWESEAQRLEGMVEEAVQMVTDFEGLLRRFRENEPAENRKIGEWRRNAQLLAHKGREYAERIRALEEVVDVGSLEPIRAASLHQLRETVRELEQTVVEEEKRLNGFRQLPPDMMLARLEVERKKQELHLASVMGNAGSVSRESASLPFAYAKPLTNDPSTNGELHLPPATRTPRLNQTQPIDERPSSFRRTSVDGAGQEEGSPDGTETMKGITITFGNLTSTLTVGLCSQGLVRLSPNVGLLSNTTTLQLVNALGAALENAKKVISTIVSSTSLVFNSNLQIFSVSRNRIRTLPDTVGLLSKLVELRCSENELESIPASIGRLTKLTTLSLDKNRIGHIPPEIGDAKAIINLDLSQNPLRVLPAELARLKFLRKLRLDECPLIQSFDYPLESTPPSLKELAARVIVRQQTPILSYTQDEVQDYLAGAHRCSFCGGPYLESFVRRGKFIDKGEYRVPLEYRLCVAHWNNEHER
ncbi:hypothetical protein HDU93_004137 [Gonapodya sp. JEL0774]|nr:hypothetical protein HDU93_004137 [Gonapodya sp. JEL0774]